MSEPLAPLNELGGAVITPPVGSVLFVGTAIGGINVNAIAPGYFETNNTTVLRTDEQRNRDILARIPAARWGTPADLGGAAVFLSSSASGYVHGTIIPVDGGWLAR